MLHRRTTPGRRANGRKHALGVREGTTDQKDRAAGRVLEDEREWGNRDKGEGTVERAVGEERPGRLWGASVRSEGGTAAGLGRPDITALPCGHSPRGPGWPLEDGAGPGAPRCCQQTGHPAAWLYGVQAATRVCLIHTLSPWPLHSGAH